MSESSIPRNSSCCTQKKSSQREFLYSALSYIFWNIRETFAMCSARHMTTCFGTQTPCSSSLFFRIFLLIRHCGPSSSSWCPIMLRWTLNGNREIWTSCGAERALLSLTRHGDLFTSTVAVVDFVQRERVLMPLILCAQTRCEFLQQIH